MRVLKVRISRVDDEWRIVVSCALHANRVVIHADNLTYEHGYIGLRKGKYFIGLLAWDDIEYWEECEGDYEKRIDKIGDD